MRAFENNVKSLEDAFAAMQKSPPSAQTREYNQLKQNHYRTKQEFEGIEPGIKPSEQPQFEELKDRLNRLEIEINMHKPKAISLFGGAAERDSPDPPDNMQLHELNQEQLINRGDQVNQEAVERMRRARTQVEQTKEVAATTELELHRQGDVLNKIEDGMEDIDSELKRSTKILGQMLRRYATDKIILCLIIVIGIVILFLIIYGAAGLDENDDFNTPDDDT